MTLRKLALKALAYTAIAFGVAATLTGCAASQRVSDAEAKYPPVGAFVEVTGGRIHYVQQGSGPHVVLLHGAGGNLRDFTLDLMDRLTDSYTVTAFDRPGLGYSDQVPQVAKGAFATEGDSPQDQAAMLREAASAIGIENPVVAGHSFGGIVAMAWANHGLAGQDPVNASAVVSMAGVSMPWPGELDSYYTTNSSLLGGAIIAPLVPLLATQTRIDQAIAGIFAPDPVPEGYGAHIGSTLAIRPDPFRVNARQVNDSRPHVVEMAKLYPQLTLPIEVIHGTADTTVPINVHPIELRKIVPTVNLTPLDGIGHMPHHADPEAAVAAIHRAARRAGLR